MQFIDLGIQVSNGRLLLGNYELALESSIFKRLTHRNTSVYGLRLFLIYQRFFLTGITDCLASIESTDAGAVKAGALNYVSSVSSVVVEALVRGCEPSPDFKMQDWSF